MNSLLPPRHIRLSDIRCAVRTAVMTAVALLVPVIAVTPAWSQWAITSCADCHSNPPADGSARNVPAGAIVGSHQKHASTASGNYGYACTVCHVSNSTFNHRNGNIEMISPLNGHAGNYTNPSGNTFAQTNSPTLYNCSATYCHSTGTGGTSQIGDVRPVAVNTSPAWGNNGTIACNSCHGKESGNDGTGRPHYATGAPKANSHESAKHASLSCDKCHNTTTTTGSSITGTTTHANRTYNVDGTGAAPYTFTYTYNAAGGSCSSMSCHGSAQWGGPAMDCVSCHGAALGNRRQVTGAGGDFVRPSRHVSNGTTGEIVIKWDCIVCHLEGNPSTGGTSTIHTGTPNSNADVNLRNVDNYATGWVWNRFGTITTAMRDNMDSFCMGCHDSLGATQINVNGTNSGLNLNNTRALTPFNTNDNLRGNTTDAGTLGAFRTTTYGRVLNVKDQFNSTNQTGQNWASHHNLNQFTKRYGTRNTTYFPNNIFVNVALKEGNLQTLGETIGLHCSDCHLNEANAHGALNSRFMLQDSSGGDTNWSGASATGGGTHVCYKCHATTTYDEASTSGRFDHSQDSARTLNIVTSPLGIICFNCHGGYSSGAQGALGAIHGTNETYVPGGATATTKRYRFMSGSVYRFYRPAATGTTDITDANWTSTSTANSCYTVAGDDTWSAGCSQHSGGRAMGAGSINYQKPLQW